jgi:hypothetical protein
MPFEYVDLEDAKQRADLSGQPALSSYHAW